MSRFILLKRSYWGEKVAAGVASKAREQPEYRLNALKDTPTEVTLGYLTVQVTVFLYNILLSSFILGL